MSKVVLCGHGTQTHTQYIKCCLHNLQPCNPPAIGRHAVGSCRLLGTGVWGVKLTQLTPEIDTTMRLSSGIIWALM